MENVQLNADEERKLKVSLTNVMITLTSNSADMVPIVIKMYLKRYRRKIILSRNL